MAAKKTEPQAETPSYEAAREELVEVVRALEAGGTSLEESRGGGGGGAGGGPPSHGGGGGGGARAGGTSLEESLALWERGEELATICQEWLDGARTRLDEAIEKDAG